MKTKHKISKIIDIIESKILKKWNSKIFESFSEVVIITIYQDEYDPSAYGVSIRQRKKPEEIKQFTSKRKALEYAAKKQGELIDEGFAAEINDETQEG